MTNQTPRSPNEYHETRLISDEHYRSLRRKTTLWLSFIYLTPIAVLAIYFLFQYDAVQSESERLHLRAIAESQANTLDLFLSER